jgi:hypothetical protein
MLKRTIQAIFSDSGFYDDEDDASLYLLFIIFQTLE